jgi:hypothetical protein
MIATEPYLGWKVYGPYKRKDGRSHICLTLNGSRKTVSYPRFLVETHLGRKLLDSEEVNHLNGNVGDDRLDNFEIIDGTIHRKLHNTKYFDKLAICKQCNINFTLTADIQRSRIQNATESGPFCSRECAGRWSTTGENKRLGRKQLAKSWKPTT